MSVKLIEDKRQQLINRAKHADNYALNNQFNGKNRYQRRLKSRVNRSVKEFNSIDMNEFFKNDILNVNVRVNGETNDYLVRIKFGGVLQNIQDSLQSGDKTLDVRLVVRALITSFNTNNVYIHCTCPDWLYRMSYWSKVNDISSEPENEQTTNGKRIVNPNDTKGPGCKHALLVISNNTWLNKVAAVIINYVKYMEKHNERLYADIIYPAVYGSSYDKDVQLSISDLDDTDELDSSEDEIDISNKEASERGRFKPGNKQGYRFSSDDANSNKQFDFDSLNQ